MVTEPNRHLLVLTAERDRHKPVGPAVVIQRVRVDDEAVRLLLKANKSAGSVNAFLSGFGRVLDTDHLEVVVFLVEVQLTVNISVLGGRPVEVASMTNVLQKVDVHDANVAAAEGRRVSAAGRSGASPRKRIVW